MIYGMIMLWSGAIVDIPPGFALCDGNNGTPDLRGRFVFGAGDVIDPGNTGGAETHDHDFTSDGHNHTLSDITDDIGAGVYRSITTSTEVDTGTTDPESNLPPYHGLAYMMYVGL